MTKKKRSGSYRSKEYTSSKAKQSPPQAIKSGGGSATSQPQVVGLAVGLRLGLGLRLGDGRRPSRVAAASGRG